LKKECAVPPLPKITLIASDYPRLEKLARVAAQQGNVHGIFLVSEIDRAEIISDEADAVRSLVTIGSWVTYWPNWGVPPRTVQVVWPDQGSSNPARISVLSPLGAALIGLREGDQMPYLVGGSVNLVTVREVNRSEPNVVPLFRRGVGGRRTPLDDDPDPTAA
jgi:regulator of nucleoside diphosphate kinase